MQPPPPSTPFKNSLNPHFPYASLKSASSPSSIFHTKGTIFTKAFVILVTGLLSQALADMHNPHCGGRVLSQKVSVGGGTQDAAYRYHGDGWASPFERTAFLHRRRPLIHVLVSGECSNSLCVLMNTLQ